jgi:hypothetical protein
MAGINGQVGRSITEEFSRHHPMGFRRKPAGVVTGPLGEGSLNLLADCQRAASVAGGDFKFTVTSPYMLARTLLDHHYGSFDKLTMALGEVLAAQMPGLPATCVQVDEANIPAMRYNTLPEVLTDAHLVATDFFQQVTAPGLGTYRAMRHPVMFSETPANSQRLPPPQLGADTQTVLESLGLGG